MHNQDCVALPRDQTPAGKDDKIKELEKQVKEKDKEVKEKEKDLEKLKETGAIYSLCTNDFRFIEDRYGNENKIFGDFLEHEVCQNFKSFSFVGNWATRRFSGTIEKYNGISCGFSYNSDYQDRPFPQKCSLNNKDDSLLSNIDYIAFNFSGKDGKLVSPGNQGYYRYERNKYSIEPLKGYNTMIDILKTDFAFSKAELNRYTSTKQVKIFFDTIGKVFSKVEKQLLSMSIDNPLGTTDSGIYMISWKKPIHIKDCGGFTTDFWFNGNGFYGTGEFTNKICEPDGKIYPIYQNLNAGISSRDGGYSKDFVCGDYTPTSEERTQRRWGCQKRHGLVSFNYNMYGGNPTYTGWVGNSKETILQHM